MDKIHLIFPIALLAFIVVAFSEWFMCRRIKSSAIGEGEYRINRRDSLTIIAITLCYALTSFLNLGGFNNPQNSCTFDERGEYAEIDLGAEHEIGDVLYYTVLHTGDYYLQFSTDGEYWVDITTLPQSYSKLFRWLSAELDSSWTKVRYVRLISGDELWLGELALFDSAGRLLDADSFSYPEGCAPLFDEQDTVPEQIDYLNSSYFDEIYHVRTAYEHMEAVTPYEISHPPLGKLIISIGIQLFGLVPFGWRFMGTLTGCLMLPVLYVFLKRMFGGTAVPAAVTILMASDFMHFAQTRIATIDSYSVFFILLMYLFMYIYLQSDRSGRGWMLPLALSGVFFGLGAATKWTCLYAGAGLGVLWLVDRIERFLEVKKAAEKENRKNKAEKSLMVGEYWRETRNNVLFCLGFFVAVPCLIYYFSYYPYGEAAGMKGISMYFSREYMDIVLDNQKYMFTYHAGVDATHPYSSRWWQWIADGKPILYYLEYYADGTKSSISAFLNPILCWGGFGAMAVMAYLCFAEKDKKARFILIGYLAQLLPWVFVSRITFAYHYFPSSVFLLLALGHIFDTIHRKSRDAKWLIWVYAGVSVFLFALFYPVLSGSPIPTEFAGNFLGWFDSWPF